MKTAKQKVGSDQGRTLDNDDDDIQILIMELKDWLNSINFNKNNLIEEDPDCISKYPPFIVNKCLSGN